MRLIVIIISTVLLTPLAAVAGDDSLPPITEPLVKSECGACHMAFQPAFLPSASWREIMATLDNHFGEDASLDADARTMIESYLIAHAGRSRTASAEPPLRITELRWFRGEHRTSEVKRMRKQREVKTLADCAACHRGAERGYYEED